MIAILPIFLPNFPAEKSSLCGDIVCDRVAGRSVLTRLWATDPLKLLSPRSAGDAAHVVSSSYGGGLLGGDMLAVRAAVRPGAELLMTTQSAGKVYRTNGEASVQTLDVIVDDDAVFAVLPDPLCAYAGARLRQRQTFDLSPRANLVSLDWITSGRHGRGERWAMREMVSRTTVRVNGRDRLRETLALDGEANAMTSLLRVGRFDCYAVLAVFGPKLQTLADAARTVVRSLNLASPITLLASDSAVVGGAVFRVLGPDVQTVRELISQLLLPLGDLLGHDPWARKW